MTELSQNNNLELQKKEVAPLEILRKEIADIKKAELEKKEKGEIHDPHFEEFDPTDLSDDDLGLYQRLKDGQLTTDIVREIQGGFRYSQADYQKKISENIRPMPEKLPQAKYNNYFLAWIVNKAIDMEYKKELKKSS